MQIIRHLVFWCSRCGHKTPQTQRGNIGRVKNPAWRGGCAVPEFLDDPGLPWKCDRCGTVVARSAHQASMGEPITSGVTRG